MAVYTCSLHVAEDKLSGETESKHFLHTLNANVYSIKIKRSISSYSYSYPRETATEYMNLFTILSNSKVPTRLRRFSVKVVLSFMLPFLMYTKTSASS